VHQCSELALAVFTGCNSACRDISWEKLPDVGDHRRQYQIAVSRRSTGFAGLGAGCAGLGGSIDRRCQVWSPR